MVLKTKYETLGSSPKSNQGRSPAADFGSFFFLTCSDLLDLCAWVVKRKTKNKNKLTNIVNTSFSTSVDWHTVEGNSVVEQEQTAVANSWKSHWSFIKFWSRSSETVWRRSETISWVASGPLRPGRWGVVCGPKITQWPTPTSFTTGAECDTSAQRWNVTQIYVRSKIL